MCKQCFFRTPSKNCSGVIAEDKSALSLVPGGVSGGSSSGEYYSEKNVRGPKVQKAIAWENFMSIIVQVETTQGYLSGG